MKRKYPAQLLTMITINLRNKLRINNIYRKEDDYGKNSDDDPHR